MGEEDYRARSPNANDNMYMIRRIADRIYTNRNCQLRGGDISEGKGRVKVDLIKMVRTSNDDSRVMRSSKLELNISRPEGSFLTIFSMRLLSLGPGTESGALRKVKIFGGRANMRRYNVKSVCMNIAVLSSLLYGATFFRTKPRFWDLGVEIRDSAVRTEGSKIASAVKTAGSTVGLKIYILFVVGTV